MRCSTSSNPPLAQAILCALLLLVGSTAVAQEKAPERGFRPAGSYALSDIETISTTSGNMMLRIPLAGLPPGRGGLAASLNLVYNSKLYDTFPSDRFVNGSYYEVNKLKQSQAGGWRYGFKYELYGEARWGGLDEYGSEISPCTFTAHIAKLSLLTPDGGKHQLRLADHTDGDGFQDVWQDGSPACSGGTPATGTLSYYTTDGTFLRLDVQHDFDSNMLNNPWTLYLPDGGRVTGGSTSQRIYDRNNNYIDIVNGTYNAHSATYINDQVGRKIIIEYESAANEDSIHVRGVGNVLLTTKVLWTTVQVRKSYGMEAGPPFSYPPSWKSVSQITLPTQAGALSYSFGYNADGSNPTVGWGEVSSITLPSGAKATYTYAEDNQNNIYYDEVLKNRPIQKQLVYRPEYDLSGQVANTPCNPGTETCITEAWAYGMAYEFGIATSSTITGPDGGVTTEYFNKAENGGVDPSELGLVYKTVAPDGTVTERYWQPNVPYTNSIYVFNETHYPKYEFTSITNTAGTLTQTAIKEYSYDKNGNVTRVESYDWVPYANVPRNAQSRPYAPPAGVQPKSVTVNTYYNPTPDASDSTTYDTDAFQMANSPRLHRTLESSEVQTSTGTALSRTEAFYDNTSAVGAVAYTIGNLTQQKSWDSVKAAITRPLTTGNSISASNQYDSYGNQTLATDARGFQTQYVYGAVGGHPGLYPTEVRAAYGTTVQRYTTQAYDYYTGVVTLATDVDNNVATGTTYDVFGRPTLVKNAQGKTEETRTAMVYSDTYRRVITRSDLSALGDGDLVSIKHYDQLGRLRLSRQLENAATESETDETDGIKVQSRYLVSGAFVYQLTSNPYRADFSYNAGSETTMGWTRTKSEDGRLKETQSFSGSGLPAPWGTNATHTGVVTTSYDAQFTTVTDQAGKLRRSNVDGLGRLIRVDEPNASGSLGTTAAPTQPTNYTYDALSNLTQVTQGVQTRTFVYSSLSRLTSVINPESGATNYQYDNGGNLVVKTDARNASAHYSYDELNRSIRRWYNGSNSPTATTHNSPVLPAGVGVTDQVFFYYDAQTLPTGAPTFTRGYSEGRLVAVTYGTGSSAGTYRGYDALGRALRQYQQTDSVNYLVEATYKKSGAMASETYPSVPGAGDRRTVSFTSDTAGRLASLNSVATSYAAAASVTGITYSAPGGLSSETLGNGLIHQATYNTRVQATAIKLGTSGNPTSVINLTYNYGTTTNNGNVQSVTYAGGGLSYTQTFGYDYLNRLTSSQEGTSWSQTNSYDRYGNRSIVGNALTFNANNNRITTSGYIYDNNAVGVGNLTNDGTQSFSYDAENKITKVNNASAYVYDGEGQRVRKLLGDNLRFIYDIGGKLLAEFDGATGSLKKEYIYGASGLVATIEPTAVNSNGTRYTTSDHLGSPRVVTNSSAIVMSRHDYKPFGEEIGAGIGARTEGMGYVAIADGLRQKFTSKERDNETGLDYFEARYYSSTQGRFTSADSVAGSLSNPQSLNLYSYTLNNPVNFTDPTGHMANPASNWPAKCFLSGGIGCNGEPMMQGGQGHPTQTKPQAPPGYEIRPDGTLTRSGGGAVVEEAVTVSAKRGFFKRVFGRVGRLLGFAGGRVAGPAGHIVVEMIDPQVVGGGDADLGDSSTPWLTPDVQSTFLNGEFHRHRLEHDTTFFRYFGPTPMIGPDVGYFSAQQFWSSEAARQMLALSPAVTGNNAQQVVSVTVPGGTIVAIGQAKGQPPTDEYPGGGSQVIVGNPRDPGIRYGTPRRLP